MGKKDILITVLALVCALSMAFFILYDPALPTASWGLHFEKPGQSPGAPQSNEKLRALDAAYLGKNGEKVLYLTFDAGYENGCTEKILDILKKHQAKAAFFLAGNYMEQNGDLVRRMVEEGHIVGNHTMHHRDMTKQSPEEFKKEIQLLETLFTETTGREMPKFYRPPQGVYDEASLQLAKQLGYKTVFWSLAYADWDNNAQPAPEKALEKVLSRTHDGAVVLLHSTSKTNAAMLDDLLTRWEEMGYRFETLDRLFG